MRKEIRTLPVSDLIKMVEQSPGAEANWLATLVAYLRPDMVVELGTGDGYTASHILQVLPLTSYFATINWPQPQSGDNPYRYLEPFATSKNLSIITGDTRLESWRFPNKSIDLLYIDSTHTYDCISEEWAAYHPKLEHQAIVVLDDLDHNDMMKFWDQLRYEKLTVRDGRVGVFRYTLPNKE